MTRPLAEGDLRRSAEKVDGLERALENEGEAGRLVLLLDGLDEVADEHKRAVEHLLRNLDRRFSNSTIVVSSRPIGYRKPLATAIEVELQPLDRARRLEFLARWFARQHCEADPTAAEATARTKLSLLEEDTDLWELSGTPLYLSLMAMILEANEFPERNRTRLYKQIFDLLLEGRYRNPEGLPYLSLEPKAEVRAALAHIAYAMTQENRDGEPVDYTVSRLYRDEVAEIRRKLEQADRWRQNMRLFLNDVARRSGIYADHDGPSADWRFWHRTFKEALAAEKLAVNVAEKGEGLILAQARNVGSDSRWAEPFALLTGHVSNADALVKGYLGVNTRLGLRAIATSPRLSGETLSYALWAIQNPSDRATIFRRIPGLLGDGDSSLHFLNQLRHQTRNGNDLFHLHQAIEETARRYPEVEKQANGLLSRLFDHIEPPPEELFRTVQTRDGEVPLWSVIPAGIFRMGHPAGVGRDYERPQHEVEIAQPFRLAVVPVTNRQYAAFDPGHPWEEWPGVSKQDLVDHPVVRVSWYAAVSFCRWLSRTVTIASGASLPTDEEWEYACRAGTSSLYWSGDKEVDLAKVGWYVFNSGGRTHKVGRLPASPWNLYDLHGQVYEWTASPWLMYDTGVPVLKDDDRQESRVIRGGCWDYGTTDCCSAHRFGLRPLDFPGAETAVVGFRIRLPASNAD